MSRIKLDGGLVAEVKVHHVKPGDPGADPADPARFTRVQITMKRAADNPADEVVLSEAKGRSRCSLRDNFDRGVGRYQALLRAFAEDDANGKHVPRAARSQIFALVVPKVRPTMKAIRNQVRPRATAQPVG